MRTTGERADHVSTAACLAPSVRRALLASLASLLCTCLRGFRCSIEVVRAQIKGGVGRTAMFLTSFPHRPHIPPPLLLELAGTASTGREQIRTTSIQTTGRGRAARAAAEMTATEQPSVVQKQQ